MIRDIEKDGRVVFWRCELASDTTWVNIACLVRAAEGGKGPAEFEYVGAG